MKRITIVSILAAISSAIPVPAAAYTKVHITRDTLNDICGATSKPGESMTCPRRCGATSCVYVCDTHDDCTVTVLRTKPPKVPHKRPDHR